MTDFMALLLGVSRNLPEKLLRFAKEAKLFQQANDNIINGLLKLHSSMGNTQFSKEGIQNYLL